MALNDGNTISDAIYTLKEDDALYEATTVKEYALIKKASGYTMLLPLMGGVDTKADEVAAEIGAKEGRTVIWRYVGTYTWFALNTPEVTVPDALPDDFS